MKKSLLALTAVAFVAMMAFAQDIKTAVSKSQSGAQTSGYVKKDVKKKTDGKTCDVCPGAEACKKAGCCAGTARARIVRTLRHVQAREHAARAATAQATLSARTARRAPRRARSIRESATV